MKKLEVFNFTDDVLDILDNLEYDLIGLSKEIKEYFKEILKIHSKRVSIKRRVKSKDSLKGKIFRDRYFAMFDEPIEVINFLSDLIGIRIECRFSDEEGEIFEILTNYFDMIDENGYYYNINHPNILLDLNQNQPQKLKNGFEIYKIDGFYKTDERMYNFELQIQSLVNAFWSDIEHEIIYKNNDYILWDNFYEEILASIKQNLLLIDEELKILDNHFNKITTDDLKERKNELEKTLSKMIYSMFSRKMKESMGFIVDFSESSDSIVKYIFKSQGADNIDKYQKTFVKTFTRINEIEKKDINFKKELALERKPVFTSHFTKKIGNHILKKIHSDFDWTLFFRILFEIELGNNVEDFEGYLEYIKYRFMIISAYNEIKEQFDQELREMVIKDILKIVADHFVKYDDLTFLYDTNLEDIINVINRLILIFVEKVNSKEEFKNYKKYLIHLINIQIVTVLNKKEKIDEIQDIIRFIVNNSANSQELQDSIKKYIDG